VVEHYLDTVGVTGSNPVSRTILLMSKLALGLLVVIAFAGPMLAQQSESDRKSNQPIKPFRVIGNIYYVGANEVTSFLAPYRGARTRVP
jgi:hypothetical protein